ncbi:hypothetical protein [Hydrogenophaga sp.]|uniref:hypothetical protein n=1 Tax=Hydrogenophaga sp. TaxID=1904254 RepID=UPI0027307E2D|nr:hypothetical protein [Hydrogenophaga sp.]MDP2074205.1 hypothetical protein [Hydrogenophaga sp.]MDP3106807.1 hypothetical protein [Hydrogenophaga sp.]MDP3351878.1 hypothetical protein [Hydrogenophaga sp.]MDZ4400185.1 hypothetical protein [Hydrogenophaga sp.]
MKVHVQRFALIALALATSAASAQFVKGNEAVRVMADGTKKVELPPLPSVALGSPCPSYNPVRKHSKLDFLSPVDFEQGLMG